MLFRGRREKTTCRNHRVIVVGRQINSFTQSPGIDSFISPSHRCKDASRSDLRQGSGYKAPGAKMRAELEFPLVPIAIDNSPHRYR